MAQVFRLGARAAFWVQLLTGVRPMALEDLKVNVKLKLSAAWATFMFLYIYMDYFHLYMPDVIEDMLAGRVFVFEITEGFVLAALLSVSIPAAMIFASMAMPAKVNRWANLIVAGIYVPYSLINVIGAEWPIPYWYVAGVEIVLLSLIIRYAWRWPRLEA